MVLKGGEVSLWYETKVVIPGVPRSTSGMLGSLA
jgi:hypothetical protein